MLVAEDHLAISKYSHCPYIERLGPVPAADVHEPALVHML